MKNKIIALWQPQAWINNYAVDIDGRIEIDVTDVVLGLSFWEIRKLRDHDYSSDDLVHAVSEHYPQIKNHSGPFEVEVENSLLGFFGIESLDELILPDLNNARHARGLHKQTVG